MRFELADRERVGRDASPTAAIIDSQSAKTTEAGGPRGYDATRTPIRSASPAHRDHRTGLRHGQDVTKAFVEHIKRIKPGVDIVDQQWPKLGEADYTDRSGSAGKPVAAGARGGRGDHVEQSWHLCPDSTGALETRRDVVAQVSVTCVTPL
jgi:hypothetical protein